MMAKESFIGTWKLISYEIRTDNGKVLYPTGKDAQGYLMYSADGYMSVSIMGANRPHFHADHPAKGSYEELAAAALYLSYAGRYEIVGDKVVHHAEVAYFPNWVGQRLERFYEFSGIRLSLSSSPSLVNGERQISQIIWERVLN